jgi:hypothetical protein
MDGQGSFLIGGIMNNYHKVQKRRHNGIDFENGIA